MGADTLIANQKRQQVYEEVRASIIESRRRPGAHLSERKLADEHGVGRRVMREALLMLASEGLVVSVPGTGAFVREYGSEEIKEQMYLRELHEGAAARFASRKINRIEAERLENLVKELEVAFGDECQAELSRLDVAIHSKVSEIAGNDIVQNLVEQGLGLQMMIGPKAPSMSLENVKEHRRIISAIVDGDSEQAEAYMRAHIRDASKEVLDQLSQAAGRPA